MSTPTEYAPIHEHLESSSRSPSVEDIAKRLQAIVEECANKNSTSGSAIAAPRVTKRAPWDFNRKLPAAPCPTPCPTPIAPRHSSFPAPLMKC